MLVQIPVNIFELQARQELLHPCSLQDLEGITLNCLCLLEPAFDINWFSKSSSSSGRPPWQPYPNLHLGKLLSCLLLQFLCHLSISTLMPSVCSRCTSKLTKSVSVVPYFFQDWCPATFCHLAGLRLVWQLSSPFNSHIGLI